MLAEEKEYAATFARAIAEDVLAHPPRGPVVRIVLRWAEEDDPLYFTVHVLGADERAGVAPGDAWLPLAWPDLDRELDRSDRLAEHAGLRRIGTRLKARYDMADVDDDAEWAPSAATVGVVKQLPAALRTAGVPLDPDFAATAAHFEGWGALAVLEEVADPALLAALEARGERPLG